MSSVHPEAPAHVHTCEHAAVSCGSDMAACTEVIDVKEHDGPRKQELQLALDDRALVLTGLF